MPRPNIRPWRDQAELLSVRKLLYPETDANNPETLFKSQRLGVNIVNTWKRRCRVPHYIDFTAVLVDARLQHNVDHHSTFTIRAIYSTAFARFVTGTCDMGQNSVVKRSMYEMAEDKDMPETWVELRHEITHGEIPDLRVLEFSVNAALSWLWVKFWVNLDAPAEETSEALTNLRAVLRSFASSRRDEIKLGKRTDHELCSTTARKLLRFSKGSEGSIQLLVSMLLEGKLMLPSQTQSELNMKPAYLIWDELLQTIAAKKRSFHSVLAESLLNGITRNATNTDDGFRKATLLEWLLHLITTPSWQKICSSSDDLRTMVMESCITNPGNWTRKLASAVLDCSDGDFEDQWQPYFDTSFLDVESDDDAPPPPDTSPPSGRKRTFTENINNADVRPSYADQRGSSHSLERSKRSRKNRAMPSENTNETPVSETGSGWRLWEGGWVPKPIGFPHPYQNEVE